MALSDNAEHISGASLVAMVADVLLTKLDERRSARASEADASANLEQYTADCLAVFPRLQTGLDVNVHFAGVFSFEYTPELVVFDVLNIRLCHAWVVDPGQRELQDAVAGFSYNALVEFVLAHEPSEEQLSCGELTPDQHRALLGRVFLSETVGQSTEYGIKLLADSMSDGELAVLFLNNHFSVVLKHGDSLCTLASDHGLLLQPVCWETLEANPAESMMLTETLEPVDDRTIRTVYRPSENRHANADYLLARSLQMAESESAVPLTDEELALQLQRDEERRASRQVLALPPVDVAVACFSLAMLPVGVRWPTPTGGNKISINSTNGRHTKSASVRFIGSTCSSKLPVERNGRVDPARVRRAVLRRARATRIRRQHRRRARHPLTRHLKSPHQSPLVRLHRQMRHGQCPNSRQRRANAESCDGFRTLLCMWCIFCAGYASATAHTRLLLHATVHRRPPGVGFTTNGLERAPPYLEPPIMLGSMLG
jgi:ubiquitin carboxyl-terminal hydrolase MINDY-1/2